jgi:DNA polymerase elongation subunit (family B)
MNKKIKRLLIDIEVSPNVVWTYAIGYKLNISYEQIIKERAIICCCYKWADKDEVHVLKWSKNCSDRDIVKKIGEIISQADEVIAHNGDRFDLKWLRTRALLHGVYFPAQIKSIDTLKKVRGNFLFNSNRLDYLSKVTGGAGKLDYGGIKTLQKIYLHNDRKALEDYIEYCKIDVLELERVYNVLSPYLQQSTHYGVHIGNEKYSCPKCGSNDAIAKAWRVSAAGVKRKRMRCKCCGYQYQVSLTDYKNFMQDRLDGKI